MKNEENKVVNFADQMSAERDFYLGKTDKIPGTDMSLEEARKKQKEVESEFEAKKAERQERVRNEQENNVQTKTSIVVPGVNVDFEGATVVPNLPNDGKPEELPSDDELKKMPSAELITLATKRGVEVKANVDTEAAIIAKLKGEYTDAKFLPLSGKSREVLDGFAVELGLGVDTEDLKGKYANAELLSDAIETARKK